MVLVLPRFESKMPSMIYGFKFVDGIKGRENLRNSTLDFFFKIVSSITNI
ncbi:hypothetical protein GCM10022260_07020 [Gaetbulibacter aestuarii]